ncbi:MAG TPA: response regulator [Candidatus Sulfotelmatobacter sp.]|jgi:two-component system OmpR family response regulator|nr:response regulator [Candidatus Sulfotelmatobacter sp.]
MTNDDSQRGTILVVDDNRDIREFAKRFLETAGWDVVTAADGAEGLRFYEQHQSNIVLLLTDVMMPNLNGWELTERVRGIDSQLPVLFMSGDDWSAHQGLECVAKPFLPAELIAKVNRVLSGPPGSRNTILVT